MKKLLAAVFLTSCFFAAFAFAQQVVNQGKPGTQGCWPVCISGPVVVIGPDGGSVPVSITQSITLQVFMDGGQHVIADQGTSPWTTAAVRCATITNSNTAVGVAAVLVPAVAQVNRIYITVCNTTQNAGADDVKCRADGVAPVFAAGNAGDYLEEGDCIQYPVNAAQTIQCIANAAGTNVLAFECTP